MSYHYDYQRAPRVYREAMALRLRSERQAAERIVQRDRQRIEAAIEQNGERVSNEGRGLLDGLASGLKTFAAFLDRLR